MHMSRLIPLPIAKHVISIKGQPSKNLNYTSLPLYSRIHHYPECTEVKTRHFLFLVGQYTALNPVFGQRSVERLGKINTLMIK